MPGHAGQVGRGAAAVADRRRPAAGVAPRSGAPGTSSRSAATRSSSCWASGPPCGLLTITHDGEAAARARPAARRAGRTCRRPGRGRSGRPSGAPSSRAPAPRPGTGVSAWGRCMASTAAGARRSTPSAPRPSSMCMRGEGEQLVGGGHDAAHRAVRSGQRPAGLARRRVGARVCTCPTATLWSSACWGRVSVARHPSGRVRRRRSTRSKCSPVATSSRRPSTP